ncbi:class I SAM-dependent methyltransferase [Streptomyces sp. NPDC087844]|uniref:class I SAM-dependent methyltransferase n=1 Tax=Streptomyces sp. NPDC087844 TaxID=3365805 RepID=UPI003809E09E
MDRLDRLDRPVNRTTSESAVSDLAPPPAQPAWAGADPYTRALRTGHGPLFLRRADGWLLPLEVERWCARADAVDLEILGRCEGSVLDIGCGPGRLVAELAGQGRRVLGIDVSAAAVSRTERLGGPALRRSVFEPLPAEGRWDTALLVDGNVGIGGDPRALLARLSDLLVPAGLLIAETVPMDVDERLRVHITDTHDADTHGTDPHDADPPGTDTHGTDPQDAGTPGPPAAPSTPFPWARIGTRALVRYATRAGWTAVDQWTTGGRSFVTLRSRSLSLRRSSRRSADPAKRTAVISSQRPRKPSAGSPVAIRYRRST